MSPTDAAVIGDEAMLSLMTIMGKACAQPDLGAMEDALLAVDALITSESPGWTLMYGCVCVFAAIGSEQAIKYVPALMPHVFTTLNSTANAHVSYSMQDVQ